MLKDLFPLTLTKLKVLERIYLNTGIHLNELSKEVFIPTSNLTRIINSLISTLNVEKKGNIKLYSINKENLKYLEPLIENYRLEKNLGVHVNFINEIYRVDEVLNLFIYGSYAKNEANLSSDLDLIIVTSDRDKVEKKINRIKKLGVLSIEVVYLNSNKYKEVIESGEGKLFNILNQKNQRIKVK